MTLPERDRASLLNTYTRLPIEIVRGEGVHLVDGDGKRYLDFFGGLAVNALGYGHPAILNAVERQLKHFMHVSNLFPQRPQVVLAEQLREMSALDAVFFANSGAEAMEAGFKLIRKWGHEHGKQTVITFSGGFHGRTMAGLSMMDAEKYRRGFGPFLEHCVNIQWNDVAALEAAVDGATAAVVYEPIQGEGGVLPMDDALAAALTRLKETHGFLLMADEIQTGMGRTGSFLASTKYGLQPDLVTLAKSLGGGLPLGALLVREHLRDVFGPGDHGSTFGGNPVACAAGIAVLELLQGGVMEQAARVGTLLHRAFTALQADFPEHILDVRGLGCMQGVQCTQPATYIRNACLADGLLVNVTRENTLRFLPPLVITEEHVDLASNILRNAFHSWDLSASL